MALVTLPLHALDATVVGSAVDGIPTRSPTAPDAIGLRAFGTAVRSLLDLHWL